MYCVLILIAKVQRIIEKALSMLIYCWPKPLAAWFNPNRWVFGTLLSDGSVLNYPMVLY